MTKEWTLNNHISGKQCIFFRAKGELLHPQRENMDVISDLRKNLGEYGFAGQYQQRPTPLEGGIIKNSWLHFYNHLPDKLKHIVLSWDTAAKTGEHNAYSVCVVLGVDTNR